MTYTDYLNFVYFSGCLGLDGWFNYARYEWKRLTTLNYFSLNDLIANGRRVWVKSMAVRYSKINLINVGTI